MLTYTEKSLWRNLLDKQGNLMASVKVGGKVAFIAKEGLADAQAEMILWERQPDGIDLDKQVFQGFRTGDADLMFVADAELLLDVCQNLLEDPIKKLRRGIRQGNVLCYFLRPKRELIDMGYEEFVELLGLPLAGCQ